jgi:lipoate---protein ligase
MELFPACLYSLNTDPAVNLAAEEELIERTEPRGPLFFLYRNEASIIIGKNQNPWKEVNPSVLAAGNPKIYRRISGGGAVYHDQGNVNFGVVAPAGSCSKEVLLRFIAGVLDGLGLHAEIGAKGDILVDGLKVSGSASCAKNHRLLCHGTLLVEADLGRLSSALAADGARVIETRAVPSRPASTANLSSFVPGLTAGDAVRLLYEAASGSACPGGSDWDAVVDPRSVKRRAESFRSWDWNYGRTPDFIFAAEISGDATVEHHPEACMRSAGSSGTGLFVSGGRYSHALAGGSTVQQLEARPFVMDEARLLYDSLFSRRYA